MEKIISNPGLHHLAEKVFWNLDVEDLKICGQINQSCKQILEKPMFWLKKFRSLSKENLKDWIKVIKLVKNSEKQKAIISYLQWNLKKEAVDLPCYSSTAVQADFGMRIREISQKGESSDEDTETVKILVPLIDNPNAPDEVGWTPIHEAAWKGSSEIVKILAPLADNPNAPNNYGDTPIHATAQNGHTEIVKILAPLTDNPNAPNKYGATPIYLAAYFGCTEFVKIIAPLTDNPNAPNNYGRTPSEVAVTTEIQKFLESFNTSRKCKAGSSTMPSKKRAKKLILNSAICIISFLHLISIIHVCFFF